MPLDAPQVRHTEHVVGIKAADVTVFAMLNLP